MSHCGHEYTSFFLSFFFGLIFLSFCLVSSLLCTSFFFLSVCFFLLVCLLFLSHLSFLWVSCVSHLSVLSSLCFLLVGLSSFSSSFFLLVCLLSVAPLSFFVSFASCLVFAFFLAVSLLSFFFCLYPFSFGLSLVFFFPRLSPVFPLSVYSIPFNSISLFLLKSDIFVCLFLLFLLFVFSFSL